MQQDDFAQQVADAYDHLYDVVYLRRHALVEQLIGEAALSPRERGWELHHLLLAAIEELDPGPQAPVFSHEWRMHRLMVLRYTDGLEPPAVAEQIGISRRHYYREHDAALQAVVSVLAGKCVQPGSRPPAPSHAEAEPASAELLRLEALRMARAAPQADLREIVQGAIEIVREMADQNGTRLSVDLAHECANTRADASILRQALLGLLGYLVRHARTAEIRVRSQQQGPQVSLWLGAGEGSETEGRHARSLQEYPELAQLDELAMLEQIRLRAISDESGIVGFTVELPGAQPRRVLVIDDNEDVAELFRRYLAAQPYEVVTCTSGTEGIRLAGELKPYAITLDLMMPNQDGWDVLQTLTNRPETQYLPIIVCTVLKVKDLALSLGAMAFLEKPVSQQDLLAALHSLTATAS